MIEGCEELTGIKQNLDNMELVQKSVGSLEAPMLALDKDALSLKEQVCGQLGNSLESWLLFDDQIYPA